jgi:GTP-binding protein
MIEARRHRLSTGEFNDLLREAYDAVSPPNRNGRHLRLYYGTQVGNDPPSFVIFVNDPEIVHFGYERYLENRIRAHFPFAGAPIRIFFRGRESERNAN